jgi:hypothetical protein
LPSASDRRAPGPPYSYSCSPGRIPIADGDEDRNEKRWRNRTPEQLARDVAIAEGRDPTEQA